MWLMSGSLEHTLLSFPRTYFFTTVYQAGLKPRIFLPLSLGTTSPAHLIVLNCIFMTVAIHKYFPKLRHACYSEWQQQAEALTSSRDASLSRTHLLALPNITLPILTEIYKQ